MKQLIIGKNVAYSSNGIATDYTTVEDGAIAIFDLTTGLKCAAAPAHNFAVVCGRDGKQPIVFPEVDVKSLTVTKATYSKGSTFACILDNFPNVEKGIEYTVIITKLGTSFNERSNWSFTTIAKDTEKEKVINSLVTSINANTETLGIVAKNQSGILTLQNDTVGIKYNVVGADGLIGCEFDMQQAASAMLDKTYIQDLASRCAAGKGFNDTYRDGDSIYPGYPEPVEADKYVLYTLRFAVPRVASKQRDEVVYQRLHIAVPEGASAISTLDSIFGTGALNSIKSASLLED